MGNNQKFKISFKFQVSSFKKLLLAILLFFSWSGIVQGATLYLDPSSGQYQPGDTFITTLRIDTEEECVNTIEANLSFSKNILKAVDFSRGKSIISIWIKPPEINKNSGLISFSGGIPGGYCGITPGDPGESNILGEIIFKVPESLKEAKTAEIKFLDNSQVLLNDGLGTLAKLTVRGANFNILSEKISPTRNEWEDKLVQDTILPNPFEIELHRDKAIFGGEYFITFSTTDKQTGIDHYEVAEVRPGAKLRETERETTLKWKVAESPYLLEDQSLQSIIKVKAIDKAGNERIAEYIPPKKLLPYWAIILVLIGAGIIWWIIRRIQKTQKPEA